MDDYFFYQQNYMYQDQGTHHYRLPPPTQKP